MNYLILFFRFLKNNLGKICLTLLFCIIFVFTLFPFGDLSDFISSKVSTITGNQVYLQFDQLQINPLSASVSLDNVLLETKQLDNLTIKNLTAIPSILSFINKKPDGQIIADGILSGKATVKLNSLPSSQSGKGPEIQKSNVQLALEKISLKDLKNTLNLSLPISGFLNLNSNSVIDFSFQEQPDGELNATIQKFELAAGSVNLSDLGSLNLPEIKFSSVELKTKFQSGKLVIETGKLGTSVDDLSGTIKGEINLFIQNVNGQMSPVINGYNLSVDLIAKPNFIERAGFFLSFIDRFKSIDAAGTRYKMKLISSGPGLPPQMSPLQ